MGITDQLKMPGVPGTKIILRYIMSIILVVALIGFLKSFTAFDYAILSEAFHNLKTWPLLVSISLAVIQVFGQVLRFVVLFEGHEKIPLSQSSFIIVQSQVMNSVIPLRTGDAFRVLKWYQIDKEKFNLTRMTGIVLAERLSDAGSLIAAGLFAGTAFVLNLMNQINFGPILSIGGVVGTILLIGGFVFLKVKTQILEFLRPVFSKRFAGSVAFSIAAWMIEFFSLYFLVRATGYHLPLHQIISVLLIVNFGIAIPISVANVGVFEAAMTFGLGQFGIPTTLGVLIATLHHFLLLSVLVVWLGSLYLIKRRTDRAISSDP